MNRREFIGGAALCAGAIRPAEYPELRNWELSGQGQAAFANRDA